MDERLRSLERVAQANPGDEAAVGAYLDALTRKEGRQARWRALCRLVDEGAGFLCEELDGWIRWTQERQSRGLDVGPREVALKERRSPAPYLGAPVALTERRLLCRDNDQWSLVDLVDETHFALPSTNELWLVGDDLLVQSLSGFSLWDGGSGEPSERFRFAHKQTFPRLVTRDRLICEEVPDDWGEAHLICLSLSPARLGEELWRVQGGGLTSSASLFAAEARLVCPGFSLRDLASGVALAARVPPIWTLGCAIRCDGGRLAYQFVSPHSGKTAVCDVDFFTGERFEGPLRETQGHTSDVLQAGPEHLVYLSHESTRESWLHCTRRDEGRRTWSQPVGPARALALTRDRVWVGVFADQEVVVRAFALDDGSALGEVTLKGSSAERGTLVLAPLRDELHAIKSEPSGTWLYVIG